MKQKLLSLKTRPNRRKIPLLLMLLAMFTFTYAQEITVTNIAGGGEPPHPYGIDAELNWNAGNPYGLVITDNGDIYIGDYSWSPLGITKIDAATGIITEFLKEGGESTGDGGPVQKATTNDGIYGMALDCEGNIYFSDQASHVVRKIDMATGYVSLVAGNYENGTPTEGAMATETPMGTPAGIDFNDDCSKMWIADYSKHYVYEIDMVTGMISTIAGTGERAEAGDGVLAIKSGFKNPHSVKYHSPEPGVEHLYIITYNNTLSRMDLHSGVLTRFVGNAGWCTEGDGGLAIEACFKQGVGLTFDPEGKNLYFGDHEGYGIRRINLPTEMIFTFAGDPEMPEGPLFGDGGPADEAYVKRGAESAFDGDGNFIFAETGDPGYVRKVDMSTGIISTVAGGGDPPPEQDLENILAVNVNNMSATAVLEKDGIVYIADDNNNILRMVDQDGYISTFAGVAGESSFKGEGMADTMHFDGLESVIWNSDGTGMYIADAGHDVIYELDATTKMLSIVVGTGSDGFTESGGMGDTTQINNPYGLSLYGDTLYWVERGNHIARKIDLTTGMVHHVAGVPGERSDDFVQTLASEAKFRDLSGIAVDPATGDVYMSTNRRDRITRVDAETDTVYMFVDGLTNPRGLNFEPDGALIVVDGGEGLKVYDVTAGEMLMEVTGVGNAYNAFITDMGGYVASQTDGVFFGVEVVDAMTMIDGYAEANDASPMTAGQMRIAGAERVLDGYITLYRDSVSARDTIFLEVLQNLVDNANTDTIVKVIQSLAAGDDASALEVFHLEYSGITSIVPDNLQAYRDSVANSEDTDIPDQAALQGLVDDVNASESDDVFAIIQGMAGGDASILETFHLLKVGIEGVVEMDDKYLFAYRDSVESQASIATKGDLQDLIDEVNEVLALENIQMMADMDDAQTLTVKVLEDAGSTGVVEENLMYYMGAVEDSTAATLPDVTALQAMLDDVNAWVTAAENALATIDGYATGNDASALTVEELETAWAQNVMADNLDAYKAEIADQDAIENLDTLQFVIDLVNEAEAEAAQAAAIAAIQGYADADDASAMTPNELTTAGAMDVDDAYLADYKMYVEADSSANLVNADSIQKFVVDPVNMMMVQEAVDSISGMARDNDASGLSHALLFQAELTDHGSDRIVDSLASKLESANVDSAAASTQELIQGLIAQANEEIKDADTFAAIQGMATGNDASDLEFMMFDELELTYNLYNYKVYQDSIEARAAIVDVADLQTLIDNADVAAEAAGQADALTVINDMAAANDASELTRNLLETALGGDALLGKTLRHFELYQDSIEGQDAVADVAALESVVSGANLQKGVEVIQDYAVANDAANMTGQELSTAGVDGGTILPYNLEAYQDSVASSGADDVANSTLIQGVVDEVNTMENANALAMILAMSNGGDTSALTIDLFKKAEVEYRDNDYLTAYKAAIYDADALGTFDELQAVVDQVSALEYIKEMPGSNDADDLTVDMLLTAGVPADDVIEANLDAYKFAVFDATEITNLDDLIAIVQETNVQVVLDNILAMAGGDASELTIEDLEYVGVPSADLYPDYLDTYKSEIEAQASIPGLERLVFVIQDANEKAALAEVQGMVGGDAGALTIDLLSLAGVPEDDLVANNLQAYKDTVVAVSEIATQGALIELIRAVNDRITDIHQLTLQNSITLFPNPTKGRIEFNFGKLSTRTFDVKVTDITGKVIVTRKLNVNSNIVDLTEYSSGVYFVKVTLENTAFVHRIVLE